jgi:hypothetical protein
MECPTFHQPTQQKEDQSSVPCLRLPPVPVLLPLHQCHNFRAQTSIQMAPLSLMLRCLCLVAPVCQFAPLPTLWKLETFVSYDDDDDDEDKQIRFVRPEQELQERPGQTLYAVDNEDSDNSIPIEEPLKKMKTEGWGAHMFPQDKWKCDTCLGHNDLNFSKCSACEAARPGHEATTAAMTELE